LALTSPTGGGRSVGIVRSRTKATEFSFLVNKITYVRQAVKTQLSYLLANGGTLVNNYMFRPLRVYRPSSGCTSYYKVIVVPAG